jgi:hypothetical protein
MNIHGCLDNLSIKMGSLYGDKVKFFREGIDSDPLTEMPGALEIDFTPAEGEGEGEGEGEHTVPVRYGDIEGTARYSVINWTGKGAPAVIFHHGSGETDYINRIRKIFDREQYSDVNVLAVSIPFNRNMKEYLHGIGSLNRFAFLLASSVRLIEELGTHLKSLGSEKIVVSGISLGGWITNLHSSVYASLDEYRPVFAGAALDHLFTDTVYRKMTASPAREHPEAVKEALNFEDAFRAKNPANVYPLLAKYDQYIRFERQKGIYLPENITVLDKGHITGSMDIPALREHLFGEALSR